MQYLKELFFLIGEKKKSLPIILFFFLCIAFLDVLGIGLIGPYVSIIVDDAILQGKLGEAIKFLGLPDERDELLVSLGLILISLFLLKSIASILMNRAVTWYGASIQVKLRSSLMQSYQSMPYSMYVTRNSSEFIYAINTLVGTVQAVVIASLKLVSDLILIIVVIVLLAFQDILALSIFILMMGSLVLIYDKVFQKKLNELGKMTNIYSSNLIKGVNQGLEGLKEIRILGKENFFYQKVFSSAAQLAIYQTREAIIASSPRFLLEFTMVSFIVLLVILTLVLGGQLESIVVTLAMFSVAGLRLLPATSAISSHLAMFRFSRDHVSRLYKDFKSLENLKNENYIERIEDKSKEEPFRELKLQNISFSYSDKNQYVLKEISMAISSGQCIGLMGSSGAGKTTLVDILLGLLNPNKGSVLCNGGDIKSNLSYWQSKIAYLPQEVFLLDDSIRNNVALGVEEDKIDNERVFESLQKARLLEFTETLPLGIDTMLGERGSRLSGGQRQRVALARSFYHERDVLVMDEATSALDDKTEKQIVDEISFLKGKKTMIVIAHRLTTLKNCDYIYELDKGSVLRSGKPEDMIIN